MHSQASIGVFGSLSEHRRRVLHCAEFFCCKQPFCTTSKPPKDSRSATSRKAEENSALDTTWPSGLIVPVHYGAMLWHLQGRRWAGGGAQKRSRTMAAASWEGHQLRTWNERRGNLAGRKGIKVQTLSKWIARRWGRSSWNSFWVIPFQFWLGFLHSWLVSVNKSTGGKQPWMPSCIVIVALPFWLCFWGVSSLRQPSLTSCYFKTGCKGDLVADAY